MAMGHIAPAVKVKLLRHNVIGSVCDVHNINGIKHNLPGINEFAKEDYIRIFNGDKVNIYDARNTEAKVSRALVM